MDPCNLQELRPVLEENGFHFSRSMGQNFLVDPSVPDRIVAASGAGPGTGVLEIGPGAGSLTCRLADRADQVVAVELDRRLPRVLETVLGTRDNVEIISGDVLRLDLAQLADSRFGGLTPLVCANLPYNITTPAITAILESRRFETVTLLLQREVGQRLCAGPGEPDYGAFTVFVTVHTRAEVLFTVPPDCFFPRPGVTSAVVRLTRRTEPLFPMPDEGYYFRVVRAAFGERRKTLPNALAARLAPLTKEQIVRAMERCGLSPTLRGEALSPRDFGRLTQALMDMRDGRI